MDSNLAADAMGKFHNLRCELLSSTNLIMRKKLNWLLVFAPIAIMGKSGLLGESSCFVLAGLSLIPLAEVRFNLAHS
jgi:hypothetical protein